MDSKLHISKRGFRCAYCENNRKGAWRWVDEHRSCEKCNRAYNPPEITKEVYDIPCPLCKGIGRLKNEEGAKKS